MDAADKILQEMDAESGSNDKTLPSALQINQVCVLKFRPDDKPIHATVRCVHFTASKVKYDLGLWLGDGTVDSPEYETRIYNVDSAFVKAL